MMEDKTYIKEVKANETGYGLLIERDGSITGNENMVKQIHEDINNHKEFVIPDRFIVSAIFQKYGIKNANGRIYPEAILKREVEKYIQNCIKGLGISSIGALDHPEASTLSLHDVSHKILDLRWDRHTLVGELELHLSPGYRRYGICSTSGDLAANLILDGILIGVSSRALGSVEQKLGTLIVGDDLDLIGWDIVASPSTNNAWISNSMDNLQQFVESKEEQSEKALNESLEKANKIIALWK